MEPWRTRRRRWQAPSSLAAWLSLLLACSETPSLPPASSAPATLRTLTPRQYEATLIEIFGADVPTPRVGPRSTSLASGAAGIGDQLVAEYERAAFAVAAWAFQEDQERRYRFTGCEPLADVSDLCLRTVIARTGRLAFRRELSPDELQRYVSLAVELGTDGPWDGLAFAVTGLLQSPHFLYRVEEVDPEASGLRYSSTTIASRLSYLLWNAPPNDALLLAAERGELIDSKMITAVVKSMLADPRAEQGRRRLLAEMFHLELFEEVQKDPVAFPEFDDELRAAMSEQFERTLSLAAKDGPLADLLTTRTTFLNDRLAALYGIEGDFDENLVPVTLPPGDPHAGALTLPALLASRSYPGHTSVALRGLFVRKDLLCTEIQPPPPEVNPSLRPPQDGELVTTRELLAEHQSDPSCRGCHEMMDPIGLGLEQFDAIGRFRATQNNLPIDPGGALDGVAFEDAVTLAEAVALHPSLDACLASKIYSYGVARTLLDSERAQLAEVISSQTSGRLHLDEVLLAIATSDMFLSGVKP